MEHTLDGVCSQLSSNVDGAGQPALKHILFHLQEKLISKREMEKKEINNLLHSSNLKFQALIIKVKNIRLSENKVTLHSSVGGLWNNQGPNQLNAPYRGDMVVLGLKSSGSQCRLPGLHPSSAAHCSGIWGCYLPSLTSPSLQDWESDSNHLRGGCEA